MLADAGSGWSQLTLKERQLPPERDNSPKYLATTGRGVHLYPRLSSGRRLVICGGEWDQMNLEHAGLNAVTSTGGSDPRGWPGEWSRLLAEGRQVRVVFDRGEEEWAEMLASRIGVFAESVRVVHLPDDLPIKTDVSDLAREWGHQALREFVWPRRRATKGGRRERTD